MASKGKVIVAKIPVRGAHPPTPEGYVKVNCTSRCKEWKPLSPTQLGPFTVTTYLPDSGVPEPGFNIVEDTPGLHFVVQVGSYSDPLPVQTAVVTNLENYWQFSKIFSPVDVPKGVVPTDISEVGKTFFERRAKGFADTDWHRHVYKKSSGQMPVGSYHSNKVLTYVPSRYYYCTYYSALVKLTPEFARLQKMLEEGTNIFLVDFDGPRDPITLELPLESNRYENLLYHPDAPFGHGLVLAGLLMDICPWNNMDS